MSLIQEMIHVALTIISDVQDCPRHEQYLDGIDETHIERIIPDSLHPIFRLLFRGTTVIVNDGVLIESQETRMKILSIAQDVVYRVANSKKLIPKHVGLGLVKTW